MFPISLLIIPLILGYVIHRYIIHPVFLSPLAKIPNAHWSSSLSPLWILLKRYRGRENRAIHAAHLKHGDIVRLGPSDLSVACVDHGIKTVYGGGFEKSNWYSNQFQNFGVPNMFSMIGNKPHAAQKRTISNVYSKSFLQCSPELEKISQVMLFDRLLPRLDEAASEKQPLEVIEINYSSTMDFIMAFIFGLQNGTNFLQDVVARGNWLAAYRTRNEHGFWDAELPGLVSFLNKLGIRIVPKEVEAASSEIDDWALKKCEMAKLSVASRAPDSSPQETVPIVYSQLSTALRTSKLEPSELDPRPLSPDLNIASEVLDHLAAGHETSGIALTYIMHELSMHHTIQDQLRSELLTLSPPIKHRPTEKLSSEQGSTRVSEDHLLPSPRSLDALPLLHAITMETLRLHAPIPGPQPRITSPTPTSLAHSVPLPPSVRVSAQAYTLHRNPRVFPSPETWNPSRWLDASEAQKVEIGRWFWAFGSGGRMCVGSNFAMQEMKLIVAAVYSNFRTEVLDDGGIEQVDAYTAGPRGNRLVLRFERV